MNDHNTNNDISDSLTTREKLHQTALRAPDQSGVYLWRNEEQNVIYVGKS